MHTPWGESQQTKTIATGLIRVDTAGHGGYKLSPERWTELKSQFPSFSPFAGDAGWLEEDSDWCLAALLWPEHFSDRNVYYAVENARSDYLSKDTAEFFKTIRGETVAKINADFALTVADHWEVGSQGTNGKRPGWFVSLHNKKGDRRTVQMPHGANKPFWTTKELDKLTPVAA